MELKELLELTKGERAVIKSKVEAILLERREWGARDLIKQIMDDFDKDLIEIIDRVRKIGIVDNFINNKSRKFRIWRDRQFRKLRRLFG